MDECSNLGRISCLTGGHLKTAYDLRNTQPVNKQTLLLFLGTVSENKIDKPAVEFMRVFLFANSEALCFYNN